MTLKLPSLTAMIEEVEYELDQRRRVYANLNARKPQATREAAEREMHMKRMQGVLDLLKQVRDLRNSGDMEILEQVLWADRS